MIGSDKGLSPDQHQAIIWTNAAKSSIRPQGKYFSEILFKIQSFHSWKHIWTCRLQNGDHFVSAAMCYG